MNVCCLRIRLFGSEGRLNEVAAPQIQVSSFSVRTHMLNSTSRTTVMVTGAYETQHGVGKVIWRELSVPRSTGRWGQPGKLMEGRELLDSQCGQWNLLPQDVAM